MKTLNKSLIAGTLAGILSVGCTNISQPTAVTPTEDANQKAVKNLIEMRDQGGISDEQAVLLMKKFLDMETDKKTTPATASNTKPTIPAVPQQTTSTTPPIKTVAGAQLFPQYKAQKAVKGRLRSIGSDTMDRIMSLWESSFKHFHAQVRFQHEGKGSSTAVPALMDGRCEVGPMSRAIKQKEIDAFTTKFGYKPTQLPVAIDALAVYVHPDNPIAQSKISLEQLKALFASASDSSQPAITTWGDLGLTGEWKDAPINLYGRNSASGTASFFKKKALLGANYKKTVITKVGSSELVRSIAGDRYAIGYSGIGYLNNTVATVPVSVTNDQTAFAPKQSFAVSNQYPLARYLYITLNVKPGQSMSDLQREFLRFVYSSDGQKLVEREGFFCIKTSQAQQIVAQY